MVHRLNEPSTRFFVAILVWDGVVATLRGFHFMQNSSKLEDSYGLVAMSPAHYREIPAPCCWLLRYLNSTLEVLFPFWFTRMEQLQGQGAAIYAISLQFQLPNSSASFLASNSLQVTLKPLMSQITKGK